MNIIIMGPQGSGKGTQAKSLAEKFNITHISTGDMFRAMADAKDSLGLGARDKYWGKGILVPDSITNKLVEKRLKMSDCKNGFILDGYPRTLGQAEYLESISSKNKNAKIDYVINLTLGEKETIKRLSGRLNCPKCGATYNLISKPPAKKMVCDEDRTTLIQRPDETPAVIKERLNEYHKKTAPLIKFYRKKGILHEVDGSSSIEEVFAEILKVFNHN